VLDENTIIFAQRGRGPDNTRDPTFLELLVAIQQNCHGLVMAPGFFEIYARQINRRFPSIPVEPKVMRILTILVANSEKDHHWLQEREIVGIPDLEPLRGVDAGDRRFVAAAASSLGSILVTDDGPLIRALEAHHIPGRYGFTVETARVALRFAGPAS
jgi:hypothetical protein